MSNVIMVWTKEDKVMVGTADGRFYSLSPDIALKLAQSLVRKAKEADPYIAVSAMSDIIDLTKEVH